MKIWSIVISLALLSATGCTPIRKPMPRVIESPLPATRPTVATTVPSTQPVLQPTTRPQVSAAASGFLPGNDNVVSIITKPVIASQPTTRGSGSTGGISSMAAEAPTPRIALTDLAKVDTSISTAPLLRLLAMKLNNIPYQRFVGYGALDFVPDLPEGTQPDKITNDILTREPAVAEAAVARLISGEVTMAFATRPPSPSELEAASKSKVKLRTDRIATEALVFTLNNANPTRNMTAASLKSIFEGKAKVWSDLQLDAIPQVNELASKPITISYRARGLGSEELVRQLLLGGQPMPELPVSKALSTTKLVMDATKEDPETIGFSGFCYVTNMQRDGKVRLLAVEGVLPEPGRVASGEYPLTTPLYVITRTDLDPKSDLASLRNWLSSMPGQRALAEAGYMPVATEAWSQQRLRAE
jgi:ABC-type phosphate transport system substrate-binding protein